MQPGWYVDPLQRFTGRLFDGVKWTNQVNKNGQIHTDPDWPPVAPSVDVPSPPSQPRRGMMTPERRGPGDRRQINTPQHNLPERRKGERRKREIVIPKT